MTHAQVKEAEARMQKGIESFKHELSRIRTGRAHPSLLEHIRLDYYGTETPLTQVANITVSDARTLTVTPWEKRMIPAIEKAIISGDLGLNPATSGEIIRIPLPPLNEERRKELIKVVRAEAENARISIRNARRDANGALKEDLKNNSITEDEEHRLMADIQKLTDRFVSEVDKMLTAKETELMAV